jgi:hypothetical protein
MSFGLANGADPETAFEWSAWAAAKGSPGPFCQPQSGTAQRHSMFVSLVDEHMVHDGLNLIFESKTTTADAASWWL